MWWHLHIGRCREGVTWTEGQSRSFFPHLHHMVLSSSFTRSYERSFLKLYFSIDLTLVKHNPARHPSLRESSIACSPATNLSGPWFKGVKLGFPIFQKGINLPQPLTPSPFITFTRISTFIVHRIVYIIVIIIPISDHKCHLSLHSSSSVVLDHQQLSDGLRYITSCSCLFDGSS